MKYAKIPLLLLSLALAMTGCIYEDMDNCYNTIQFSYKGDGNTEVFAEYVTKVDLYVFDENQRCVLTHTLTQEELEAQSTEVMLVPNKTYRAVCIGNALLSQPLGLEGGVIGSIRMHHPVTHPGIPTEQTTVDSQDPLYYGNLGSIEIPAEGKSVHTVAMNSSHIDMTVTVKGYVDPFAETRAQGDAPISVEHDNLPVWLDFDNRFSKNEAHADRETMTHYPVTVLNTEGNYFHEYNVMKDVAESRVYLRNSQGAIIYDLSVDDFVAANNIDITKQETSIDILFEFKSAGVEVTIPDWALEDTEPEF